MLWHGRAEMLSTAHSPLARAGLGPMMGVTRASQATVADLLTRLRLAIFAARFGSFLDPNNVRKSVDERTEESRSTCERPALRYPPQSCHCTAQRWQRKPRVGQRAPGSHQRADDRVRIRSRVARGASPDGRGDGKRLGACNTAAWGGDVLIRVSGESSRHFSPGLVLPRS